MISTKRTALAGAVLALMLAGCGTSKAGSGSPATTAKSGESGSSAPAAPATAAGSASGLPIWDENRKMNDNSGYDSAISKAMGFDASKDASAQQAEFRQREQKRQEAIAECMRAEGWQYTPYVNADSLAFTPPGYDLTRKEYVDKYGFGIVSNFEDNEARAPTGPDNDPNNAYMTGLSSSEQEAYSKSLYGNPTDQGVTAASTADGSSGDAGAATTVTIATSGPGAGCFGKADATLNGTASDADRAFMDEFNRRISTYFEKVQADPRIVAANRVYATCMAEKGYPEIDKQQAAYEKVSTKMSAVFGGPDGSSGGYPTSAAPSPDSGGGSSAGGSSAGVSGTTPADGSAPSVDKAKLAEVKTYELAVAKADLACGKNVAKVNFEVSAELEKKFAQENAADLSRFGALSKAGVNGAGGG